MLQLGRHLSPVPMPHSTMWLCAAGGAAGYGDGSARCGAAHRPRLPVRAQAARIFCHNVTSKSLSRPTLDLGTSISASGCLNTPSSLLQQGHSSTISTLKQSGCTGQGLERGRPGARGGRDGRAAPAARRGGHVAGRRQRRALLPALGRRARGSLNPPTRLLGPGLLVSCFRNPVG